MNETKTGVIVAVAAVIALIIGLVAGYAVAPKGSLNLAGNPHLTQESFPFGIKAGDPAEEVISSAAAWVGDVIADTIGYGNEANSFGDCVTNTSYNPAAVASSTPASATTTVSGAVLGYFAKMTVSTTTQGLIPYAYVSAADEVTYGLFSPDGDLSAVNLGTSTATICVSQYDF